MTFDALGVGKTTVKTTKVGFGCGGIGNLFSKITDAEAHALLRHAWASGVTYFDTAPHYGRGRSEARLGAFLRTVPQDKTVISTKVGRVLTPGQQQPEADGFVDPLPNDVHFDYSGKGILASLEGSMARLGRNKIDIVYVHDIGQLTHGADNAWHMDDLLASGLPMLQKLKAEGTIGAVGLGVNECEVCINILDHADIDVILLAGRWTLLDRSAERALVPLCRARGTSLVLGGIFNSGILATGPTPDAWYNYQPAPDDILKKVATLQFRAEAAGLTLAEAAMHFAMSRELTSSVLIGTGKMSSLQRNLVTLTQDIPASATALF